MNAEEETVKELKDKVAVVTGGASGIGKSIGLSTKLGSPDDLARWAVLSECIHRRRERIDPQRFPEIRGGFHDHRIDADSNRIGDAVQHAEVGADDRRRRDCIGT